MSELSAVIDQLRRAFDGDAWHGDSVLEILGGVDAKTAAARPIAGAHSIWELVLHVAAWDGAVRRRMHADVPVELSDDENFPAVRDASEAAWRAAVEHMKKVHGNLLRDLAKFPEQRLGEKIPGKDHDFRNMFWGLVQHEIYHAGQMSLLKKAAGSQG